MLKHRILSEFICFLLCCSPVGYVTIWKLSKWNVNHCYIIQCLYICCMICEFWNLRFHHFWYFNFHGERTIFMIFLFLLFVSRGKFQHSWIFISFVSFVTSFNPSKKSKLASSQDFVFIFSYFSASSSCLSWAKRKGDENDGIFPLCALLELIYIFRKFFDDSKIGAIVKFHYSISNFKLWRKFLNWWKGQKEVLQFEHKKCLKGFKFEHTGVKLNTENLRLDSQNQKKKIL